jgi:RecJ-like exonuclease
MARKCQRCRGKGKIEIPNSDYSRTEVYECDICSGTGGIDDGSDRDVRAAEDLSRRLADADGD